jgi:hypothetical protein
MPSIPDDHDKVMAGALPESGYLLMMMLLVCRCTEPWVAVLLHSPQ